VIKVCNSCNQEKNVSEFYQFYNKWTDKNYNSSRCKPCHLQYKIDNPNNSKNKKSEKLKLRYGITYDDWELMREKENFSCMICGITEEEIGKKLDVDHCHSTGKVRGILCNPCNTTLGHAKDNIDILKAAIQYLKNNKGGYK
jgi:DNA gyrase inhibitor GyrI